MNKEFIFGPEHVGKRVKHVDGRRGKVFRFTPNGGAYAVTVDWGNTINGYTVTGRSFVFGAVLISLDEAEQQTTVVDQLNDIHYTTGGGANFRLTVTDGNTEHTAAVDLFEFLIWAQADGLIDSYSAENVGEEVVILPIPDEEQNHRATAQVKRLYVWLQQLPLATFTRALNERPAIWSSFDQNMEPINA